MTIKVFFLGRLADAAGTMQCELAPDKAELDWPELLALFDAQVSFGLAEAVRDLAVKLALNGVIVTDRDGVVVRDGDEIALLPPVSGG